MGKSKKKKNKSNKRFYIPSQKSVVNSVPLHFLKPPPPMCGFMPPIRTLVVLSDGTSPHIPSITANTSNTNPPKSPTAIITESIATNLAETTAANANIANKNKAKDVKAVIATKVVENETDKTLNADENPPGHTNQPTIEPNPEPPKTFNNQQKKKWLKLQAKLQRKIKGISVNLVWRKSDASVVANEPGNSDTSQNSEASQGALTMITSQTSEAPTATSTAGANPGSSIPTTEPSKYVPKITLKTKKSLQQEMVRQRLNWIKPDTNVTTADVLGTSAAPEKAVQIVPPKNTPPIKEVPQAPLSAGPIPGSSIPTLENHTVQPNQRSNAGSFFRTAVPPAQTSPKLPRGPNIYAYTAYPKGIPRSFLLNQQKSLDPGGQAVTADSPIWPSSNMGVYQTNTSTSVQPHPVSMGDNTNRATSPIFVQAENPTTDVQQPYSPSDIYSELGNNPEPPEDLDSSEQNQSGQKRLSAFQRLGPLSQPKKPKLTINLNLNKEQPVRDFPVNTNIQKPAHQATPVCQISSIEQLRRNIGVSKINREVVNDTDDDPDKYTPVHLRKDIITSTDGTVVKYLQAWPWRKNVRVKRSVTARISKSVMILEQERMEEWYDKENLFVQITVKGYPSTWTKERVLEAVLDSVKGHSFIPCFIEFSQHECKFLVIRSRTALLVLHKTGFYIHKDGVELTITISLTVLSLNHIDFIPRIILRKRMLLGYADKKLNLSAFTLQNDISHFIYFPLNHLSNQKEFMQLQSTINWDHLTELDLSHNRLTNISGFDLPNMTPRLKHLNLSHNYLDKITVLLNCRQLPLNTIHLEGNPLCHDYIDPEHYIKVIRMMFPAVVEIDGVPIHRKGELPHHKQNYCPEEAEEVTEKFLEIFFPLLDSGPDHRSLIQGMYEDDATLTITYCYKLRYGQKYRCLRNLFLYARFLDEGETDSVVGAMAITKLINRWPHTEHDPFTFTVDVLYHTESTTILRISGVLKLTAETLAEDEHLLSFTRTVVLYSEDGAEYKIRNEMVYWDEPTAAAARSAFRVNTISQKNFNLKIESTTDEDLRDKFLKIFMKLTTMDKKISERCLEINNWNFKLALEHFTKLLKLNNLDSLTQEVQAAT